MSLASARRFITLWLLLGACNASLDSSPLRRDASADGTADAKTSRGEVTLPDANPHDATGNPSDATSDAASEADAAAMLRCVELMHIGDSLTAQTREDLRSAYDASGWPVTIDAYGGRAILQKLSDDPKTGKQAALDANTTGFSGCWLIALGTNDTANIAAGAWYTRAEAIDDMLEAVDPDRKAPVLWVNTYTLRTDGYWANANMRLWNEALQDARARWPNLVVLDWAGYAQEKQVPFSDGIHHTGAGYAERNRWVTEQVSSHWR